MKLSRSSYLIITFFAILGILSGYLLTYPFNDTFGQFINHARFILRNTTLSFEISLTLAALLFGLIINLVIHSAIHHTHGITRKYLLGFFIPLFSTFAITLVVYSTQSYMHMKSWGISQPYTYMKNYTDSEIINKLEDDEHLLSNYYLSINDNSYEGFCDYDAGSYYLGYYTNLRDIEYLYGSKPTCNDTQIGWAAEAKLIQNGASWCVDTTGYSGEVKDETLKQDSVICR